MREFVEASSGDPIDRLADVYERLFHRWRYLSDPEGGGDWLISAEDMLAAQESRGDCEDFAVLVAASVQAFPEPWPCRIVFGSFGRAKHAFTEVRVGGTMQEAMWMLERLASRWKCDLLTLPVTLDRDGPVWLRLDLDGPPVPRQFSRELVVYPDSRK